MVQHCKETYNAALAKLLYGKVLNTETKTYSYNVNIIINRVSSTIFV